ncbi:LysR family transcriptional regulator [Pollutimonas sp. H1-120]|uniref:LysR family transcriptional regulator n=1 Tax=Pollutimonas sp. H1-120 TaxID=3148824 RepID=UPI003B51C8B7
MNISLVQLRAFIAVSRYGSFTLAAEALHRTQPAITVQVKQLEENLGLKLFDRTTRQLRLTTVGLELVPALSAMLHQLDGVIEISQNIRTQRTGVIRIACLPSVASSFLPVHIAEFRKQHPGISFLLSDALGDKVISMVTGGDVEFGLTDTHPNVGDLDITPLLEEQMCALFLEGHPIQSAEQVDVNRLSAHDLVLMAHGSNARRIVDNAFAAQGRVAVASCEASYMSTAVGMVQAGLGIALLPRSGVNLQVDGRLRARLIQAPGFSRQIAIVKLKQRSLSPSAESFVQLITAASKDQQKRFNT